MEPTMNPYDMASSALGNSKSIYERLMSGEGLANINSYINPYFQQVLDTTLGRMGDAHKSNLNAIGDNAISAGAFGGSRHGVAEGVANSEYAKAVGDVTANVSANAFNTAAGMAREDMFGAATGLTGLGKDFYDIGNNLTDRQAASGAAERGLWQQILDMGNQEFQNYMQNPYQMMDIYSALLGNDVRRGVSQTEQQSTPGLFDYISVAAQAFGGK